MAVQTLSRLGASITPKRYRDAYRKFKKVLRCRTSHVEVPTQPYFDPVSAQYFREQLAHTRNYLEYGSGGSTILAHRRVNILVSVDSDAHFLAAVRRKLAAERDTEEGSRPGASTMKLIHVNIGFTEEWGMPAFTRPTPRRVHRWEDYPAAPWRFFRSISQEPDLILVDGRFRVACVLESMLNLSASSESRILVDDYLRRPHYQVVERFAEVEMVGRMAILHPKQGWDHIEARRLIQQYRADCR